MKQQVHGHQARVMVVDDDAMLRTLMRVRLKKQGYMVLEATDGSNALQIFTEQAPDIVLMDANMPGMDGFEATAALKDMPGAAQVPILMVSGLEDDASVDKAFSVGAVEYITKPICWPLLIHRLANICDAMRAESRILQSKADADRANQSKSEFLANMSHELRTPLHAILSFAAMGLEKSDTAPIEKLVRYFTRISESGRRLLLLLNALLDLSKLEAGAMECNIKQADLMSVVQSVVKELASLASDGEVILDIQAPAINTAAFFDEDRVFQVVRNLVSNAIKFTPAGKRIVISFSEAELPAVNGVACAGLSCTVADEGIGIPQDELQSVFDKFVQSSKTKTGAGGTGLGLAISKEIVERQGGKIFAENNADGGASFHFVLPRELLNVAAA